MLPLWIFAAVLVLREIHGFSPRVAVASRSPAAVVVLCSPSWPGYRPSTWVGFRSFSLVPGDDSASSRSSSRLPMLQRSAADLWEQLPSDSVIAAVERSPANRVVASDVAAAAGVSLSQARKDLMALAALTRGDLAVDADGEILYAFPPNLRSVLAERNLKYRAMQTFQKVWPALFWLIRVSFGVALLASIVLVFSTIFFLQTSSSSSDDDRRRNDRGGGGGSGMMHGGSSMWFGPSPFDVFYYRPYGYYAMPNQPRDPSEMGFLESVFSYIFGDGDPNAGLEEKRLKLAANAIRANGGAVTAEQLAPFCDPVVPAGDDSSYVNENFVLPVVTALNGEACVTEDGDIIYVFPELQVSATESSPPSSKKLLVEAREALVLRRAGLAPGASARQIRQLLELNRISTRGAYERQDLIRILEGALPPVTEEEEAELLLDDPTVLQERPYKFSLASDLNKALAGGLGILNLGGALYLGNLLGQYAMVYGTRLPTYMGTVQSLYPLLLGYAVLFNVIPLVRNFWIQQQNAQISSRNARRRQWATFLASASDSNPVLRRKLLSAARLESKVQRAGGDIVYDTSRPSEEVEQARQEQALQDFDKLLEQGEDSGSFQ